MQKKTGMYLLGTVRRPAVHRGADRDDLDFFPFPEIDSEHRHRTLDAPIDGFMMAAEAEERGRRQGAAGVPRLGRRPRTSTSRPTRATSAANSRRRHSGYNALQKKAAELIGSATNIAQFLDRDTRPDFASTVMIPALQDFIKNPKDIDGLTVEHREAEEVDLRLTTLTSGEPGADVELSAPDAADAQRPAAVPDER